MKHFFETGSSYCYMKKGSKGQLQLLRPWLASLSQPSEPAAKVTAASLVVPNLKPNECEDTRPKHLCPLHLGDQTRIVLS